ncbi:MAG: SBBP repeat-containing protein, partial [Pseudomonadota bacterium]|nr:SBBP repeat-containing protein [Pseudomonadota bacterium]
MKRIQNIIFMALSLFYALLVPMTTSAEVVEEWVQRYDGGSFRYDKANSLAVDAAGNVYVTGYSSDSVTSYDYATIKYNTNGNLLWVQRYDGGSSGLDEATSLAVDAVGNVYVTGYSFKLYSGSEYATIKYDTDGNLHWIQRYNGGSGEDKATSLVVDAAGNVYVTGMSNDYDTGADYATIKYDTDGNLLWVQRYDGGRDYTSSLAVDAAGNVYVTGYSETDLGESEYATIKYDTNGNLHWVQRYNGSSSGVDEATSLAVDAAGNVYVTGESYGDVTRWDYATIKYDTNGNLHWVQRYDGGISGYDKAMSLAVDAAGNVYVTGESFGEDSTGTDYATIKYDTSGNLHWVQRYDGAGSSYDEATSLDVDAEGNVYVTGESYDDIFSGTDYATIKYDSNGNLHWVQRYDGGSSGFDKATSLVVDAAGNVHVTGYSDDAVTEYDYATIKYSEPVVTPGDMMEKAIEFYEEHLADGTIYGLGSGDADTAHEQLFGRMLDNVYELILAGDEAGACKALSKVV